jgi:hypothetical protein
MKGWRESKGQERGQKGHDEEDWLEWRIRSERD